MIRGSADPVIGIEAAGVLAEMGRDDGLQLVQRLLNEKRRVIRELAALALPAFAKRHASEVLEGLRKAAADDEWTVRIGALDALRRIGTADATAVARTLCQDRASVVRTAADREVGCARK